MKTRSKEAGQKPATLPWMTNDRPSWIVVGAIPIVVPGAGVSAQVNTSKCNNPPQHKNSSYLERFGCSSLNKTTVLNEAANWSPLSLICCFIEDRKILHDYTPFCECRFGGIFHFTQVPVWFPSGLSQGIRLVPVWFLYQDGGCVCRRFNL